MKKGLTKKIIALAAVVAAGAAAVYFSGGSSALEVKKAVAERGSLVDTYTETGRISSGSDLTVISEVTCRLVESRVSANQTVNEGDVLFVIDSSEFEYQRAQSAAQISAYRAQLSGLQIGNLMSVSPQEYLSQVREGAELAKSALADAENSYNASKELYEIGAVSKAELDKAKLAYDSALESSGSAEARYEQSSRLKQQLESNGISESALNDEFYRSEERQLSAMISAQSSSVSYLDDMIAKCTVKAPASGTIKEIPAEGLSAVAAYQPLAVISGSREDIYVETSVLTSVAPYLQPGDKAELKMELRGGSMRFPAVISEVYDHADEGVSPLGLKEYRVTVRLRPEDPEALSSYTGYETDVIFTLCDEKDALIIPGGATFEKDGRDYVFVIEGGKAAAREVELGYRAPSEAIVLSGLSEGDEIIDRVDTKGIYEGAEVRFSGK
ncbi:MAG: HlyD family efflux transporter periplasmic adaptor subunit [Firmicutes bacterium]|nr:HlyD family efflux transporter periplasmic adaptor subunit [Bacillota bacterium]